MDVNYEIKCPGKQAWPELVGANAQAAKETIEKENPLVRGILIKQGTKVLWDYHCNRVRIFYDEHGLVVMVPRVG